MCTGVGSIDNWLPPTGSGFGVTRPSLDLSPQVLYPARLVVCILRLASFYLVGAHHGKQRKLHICVIDRGLAVPIRTANGYIYKLGT
jgi:hypothetical protein